MTEEAKKIETLEEARQFVRANFVDGTTCPCCGQTVKLRARQIYWRMAVDLIRLYRLSKKDPGYPLYRKYHHRETFEMKKAGGGDFHKLEYWGLVEAEVNLDTEKRSSGNWKITDKGIAWVLGQISVPKYAYVYNKKVRAVHGDHWHILDALGKKFSYRELMGHTIGAVEIDFPPA